MWFSQGGREKLTGVDPTPLAAWAWAWRPREMFIVSLEACGSNGQRSSAPPSSSPHHVVWWASPQTSQAPNSAPACELKLPAARHCHRAKRNSSPRERRHIPHPRCAKDGPISLKSHPSCSTPFRRRIYPKLAARTRGSRCRNIPRSEPPKIHHGRRGTHGVEKGGEH